MWKPKKHFEGFFKEEKKHLTDLQTQLNKLKKNHKLTPCQN